MNSQHLIDALTPVVTSLVMALWMRYHDNLPRWLVPTICVALGVVGNQLATTLSGSEASVWLSVALGLAAIGVREVQDQLRKGLLGSKQQPESVEELKAEVERLRGMLRNTQWTEPQKDRTALEPGDIG